MTIHIVDLMPHQAVDLFPELQPYILRALQYDPVESITLKELLEQVRSGMAKVMIAAEDATMLSATVVQLFKTTAGETVLHVVATAGDRSKDWLPVLVDHLSDIGRREGAKAISMSGRPGWTRKLSQFGFKTEHVVMRLDIENGRSIEKPEPAIVTAASN